MMGMQLDLFPETLEGVCGPSGNKPETSAQAESPDADSSAQADALTSPANAFATMGAPSGQRYLPLDLLH
ncbi:MAG: hypothetical protein ACO3BJ_06775 [Burkholderiaceae bacterium]